MENMFFRVGAAAPHLKIGDCTYNSGEICKALTEASARGIDALVFPELSITGYSVGDLLFQSLLLERATDALSDITAHTKGLNLLAAVGLPIRVENRLYNCAAILWEGEILGLVPKTSLPNTGEFYEQRWFTAAGASNQAIVPLLGKQIPFGTDLIFSAGELIKIGVELCEDLWGPIPPSARLALGGATIILNLSASNELTGKASYRRDLIKTQSVRTHTAYACAGAGSDESTTDVVFSGHCLIGENGVLLSESPPFAPLPALIAADIDAELLIAERRRSSGFAQPGDKAFRLIPFTPASRTVSPIRTVSPHPFISQDGDMRDRCCREIFDIQTVGLLRRLEASHAQKAVVGISGGLDSTLALLVTAAAFDRDGRSRRDISAITMPGFGTTGRTYENARALMEALNVTAREIPIGAACLQHFSDIGLDPADRSPVYENAQARARTQILMDVANMESGLVVGTGDLSEIALGWSTYGGDHMSMYAVNAGVPKTLVQELVIWSAEQGTAPDLLLDIAATPVSPELLPPSDTGASGQITEDILGPYALHDFFLYHSIRYGFGPKKVWTLASIAFKGTYLPETIKKWMHVFYTRFFSQQFKRSCMPDGPKVGPVALSPRGDWRMPSDAAAEDWLLELERLPE